MLSFNQSLILALVSSGISSIIIGGILTYFLNKKLSRQEKILEVRKQLYTDINETLAGFFDTADEHSRQRSCQELLVLLRRSQIWASKEVLKQLNTFLFFINEDNKKSQGDRDREYKKLVISMRKCMIEESVNGENIHSFGKIN